MSIRFLRPILVLNKLQFEYYSKIKSLKNYQFLAAKTYMTTMKSDEEVPMKGQKNYEDIAEKSKEITAELAEKTSKKIMKDDETPQTGANLFENREIGDNKSDYMNTGENAASIKEIIVNTEKDLSKKVKRSALHAKDKVKEVAEKVKHKGKDVVEDIKHKGKDVVEDVKKKVVHKKSEKHEKKNKNIDEKNE